MTDKELKKLKRSDLLEIMVAQSKEIDRLQAQVEDLKAQLNERQLKLDQAGSLAEAALSLYEVIERTQKAADLYLENVKGAASNHPQAACTLGDAKADTKERE